MPNFLIDSARRSRIVAEVSNSKTRLFFSRLSGAETGNPRDGVLIPPPASAQIPQPPPVSLAIRQP
jgi:hypothetical protein